MQCSEVQSQLWTARYDEAEAGPVARHLETCGACAALARQVQSLDGLLDDDELESPRPGFDTRFFARLDELQRGQARRGPRWWWYLVGAGSLAAATAGLLVALGTGPDVPTGEELELAMHLELLEEVDMLAKLEAVEAYQVLAQVDAATLERMLGDQGGQP